MRTIQWEGQHEGLLLTCDSHAWRAGQTFSQRASVFNIMQAGLRRPVRARLAQPIGGERRLGRIVLTPADFEVYVETIGEETDFPVRTFNLDAKWLTQMVAPYMDFDFARAEAHPVFDDPVISSTLDRIHAELTTPGPGAKGLLDTLLRMLAIDTARLQMARSRLVPPAEGALTSEQFARVRCYIETSDFRGLTPARVAEDCEISLPRLRDAFRRTTGTSLRQQIEQARMAAAKRMLLETGQPLKMIAHQLDFAHASAFCYAFKQVTGLTPTEYRLRNAVTCEGAC
ncbi:helix-turn-helix transcriptional regulator [Novosphingobium rosa]|uniref:helix-turn-helix transcriptional regulator n=1 Tax=Novosphingobium rosa TaxID=76978 RepID=UPI00082E538B|nr:AraC family transcriptional regulator [Novosphingobium rosa]